LISVDFTLLLNRGAAREEFFAPDGKARRSSDQPAVQQFSSETNINERKKRRAP
jgi:hypothetical protein